MISVMKEEVIPTTLRKLLYMTLRLRDTILTEKPTRVGWLIIRSN